MKHRKRQRLQFFDYSLPGWYFVTICTKDREHFFGRIEYSKMQFSEIGKYAERLWMQTPHHIAEIVMDEFVVMPNHVHAIVIIKDGNQIPAVGDHYHLQLAKLKETFPLLDETARNKNGRPQNKILSKAISGFKAGVTREVHRCISHDFKWHKSFHDRIIRDQGELMKIRNYIQSNVINWYRDIENRPSSKQAKQEIEAYYDVLFSSHKTP